MKYYKTHTLGCKVNTYETQAVKEMLEKIGYSESFDQRCDLFLINTCAVTKISEHKSKQKIHSIHTNYPTAKIVVMGCYAQLKSEEVLAIDGVSLVLGTDQREKLISLLLEEKEGVNIVNLDSRQRCYENLNISSYSENTRAFLKIQDGCNNFCSYCIIPYTRGNFRSRDKKEIIQEAQRLVSNGFKEIVLTGIDTASYGKDLIGETFESLLESTILAVPDLKRLRISSIEASQISDSLIDLLKKYPQIAPHLHIPLQSGSEGVLKRMNRKYTKEQFLRTIKKIKTAIPLIALAADVIVGFPQESEEEFNETVEFVKECEFDQLHVFPYSPRPGTVAERLSGQVPTKIKKERVRVLIELSKKLQAKYEEQFEGKEVEVLVERYDPKTQINRGLTSNYLEVKFKDAQDYSNQIKKVIYHR